MKNYGNVTKVYFKPFNSNNFHSNIFKDSEPMMLAMHPPPHLPREYSRAMDQKELIKSARDRVRSFITKKHRIDHAYQRKEYLQYLVVCLAIEEHRFRVNCR